MDKEIKDLLVDNYMPYTAYVIRERALPEIDGFKPSQRRILYTMYKMGLLKGVRKKSQGIVGQTMFLHPHGDGAIYETLVRMTKDAESFLTPMVDSKGNFGKQYSRDMQYASARYTEVRLAKIAKELFADIDKNTVEMVSNYDGTLKEPKLLPVSFPIILTNPQSGIANGMASNFASFNINEVIDCTIAYIKNPKTINISDYIKAPDFPTGGNIINNMKAFSNIFENGLGSFDIRATYKIEDNSIVFEEIPYNTSYEIIIEKISQLVKDGKLKEVIDVDNIYGINTKGIEVTVKNNTDKELLVERLYKLTPLQTSFSCNFNMIINGMPKVLGVKDIIHQWLQFRVGAIKNGLSYEIGKKQEKLHNLLGLQKVLLDIDRAIKIIRETNKNSEVIANLMSEFKIDKIQAEYVSEIKLRALNKENLIQRVSEIEELTKEVDDLNDLISNRGRLAKMIIRQLEDVKKEHGQERKSKIIEVDENKKLPLDKIEVENYNVKIFVTNEGYLKKIPLTSLRGNFNIATKDEDFIIKEVDTTNNSDVIVFTDKRNVYKLKSYDIKDHKPSQLGEFLPSLLELNNEKILYVTATNDYKGYIVIGFNDGKVAKIDLSAYETKQNRSMLKNGYADKEAIYFNHIIEDVDVLAVSSIDKALVFNTSMINSKSSKTTIGIQVMKSKNDSYVVSYISLNGEYEEAEYYRTSNAGIGKYVRKGDFINM